MSEEFQISFPVFSFMATEGLEDVEDGDLIHWKLGDEAWWIPSYESKFTEPVLVEIDSGRGAHRDAPMLADGISETVYEVIFPDGRYSVRAHQLRHKNFKPPADARG